MTNSSLNGSAMLRPVRLGLLVREDVSELLLAVDRATSSWGGLYTPLLDPDNRDDALGTCEALGVDAIYAADNDPAAREICSTPGYQWINLPPYGPYDEPAEYGASRILSADMFIGTLDRGAPLVRHTWEADDPLSLMFKVWFGAYGASASDRAIAARFANRATSSGIDRVGPVASIGQLTPIQLTAAHIEYTGESTFDGFVVVDPSDPIDLIRFWNVRAYGGQVFPWPLEQAERVRDAAGHWVGRLRANGMLNRWRRGDGSELPPHLSVLVRPSEPSVPDDLLELLSRDGVDPRVEGGVDLLGWTGVHPIQTAFTRSFSLELAPSDWSASIPLPALPLELAHRSTAPEMLVAAQISVYRENDTTTTRWATIPNIRALSELLARTPLGSPMNRPVSEGRVAAVSTADAEFRLALIAGHDLATALFRGSQWAFEQSDPGIFATRLGTMLGGANSDAAMQPAVRKVLTDVVRSPHGKRLNQLDAIVSASRGDWPGTLFAPDPQAYIKSVPLRLLRQKLLRPYLYLRCPECTIPTAMSPEQLATDIVCPMCSASYPLGFALGHTGLQAAWMYRTPPNIDEDRLLGALALLAARAALRGWGPIGHATPHIFGAELKAIDQTLRGRPEDPSCEMDLLVISDFRGQPQVIVGEVKHKKHIDESDLANMLAVQTWFASQGIDCWPLFATLRKSLGVAELDGSF